ncbi:MAG: InlB B-repeat-containing protein, partial [Acholeplasmatales bacterium]|nr:InlB B-repeat-containing protein [Acholeplasmatales bacterium]
TRKTSSFFLPNPIKEGSTFLGWYDNPKFNPKLTMQVLKGTSKNLIFYAKWSDDTEYELIYNILNEPTELSSYNAQSESLILKVPTPKKGYEFSGWFLNPSLEGESLEVLPQGSKGTKILYGRYYKEFYVELHIDNNVSEILVLEDHHFVIPEAPIKEGYSFVDWYYDSDFTKVVDDSDSYLIITANISLYALFTNEPEYIQYLNEAYNALLSPFNLYGYVSESITLVSVLPNNVRVTYLLDDTEYSNILKIGNELVLNINRPNIGDENVNQTLTANIELLYNGLESPIKLTKTKTFDFTILASFVSLDVAKEMYLAGSLKIGDMVNIEDAIVISKNINGYVISDSTFGTVYVEGSDTKVIKGDTGIFVGYIDSSYDRLQFRTTKTATIKASKMIVINNTAVDNSTTNDLSFYSLWNLVEENQSTNTYVHIPSYSATLKNLKNDNLLSVSTKVYGTIMNISSPIYDLSSPLIRNTDYTKNLYIVDNPLNPKNIVRIDASSSYYEDLLLLNGISGTFSLVAKNIRDEYNSIPNISSFPVWSVLCSSYNVTLSDQDKVNIVAEKTVLPSYITVSSSYEFPSISDFGVIISWSSSNPEIINPNAGVVNIIAGEVFIVVLEATFTLNDIVNVKTYTIVVIGITT